MVREVDKDSSLAKALTGVDLTVGKHTTPLPDYNDRTLFPIRYF